MSELPNVELPPDPSHDDERRRHFGEGRENLTFNGDDVVESEEVADDDKNLLDPELDDEDGEGIEEDDVHPDNDDELVEEVTNDVSE